MKYQLHTEIIIKADLETVWSIFSDFEHYPNWNPFIKSIQGNIKVGERFKAEIGDFRFKPTVQVFNEKQELTWLGRLLIPGIFDGKHSFFFTEESAGTTTLVQREDFRGILVPFMKKKLSTEIKQGFESMNMKLKELAEQA